MNEATFRVTMFGIAGAFTAVFCVLVVPPLIAEPDIIGAFAAGFVNPYSSGYSTDVIFCWVTLAVWVFYEQKRLAVRGGWICLLLGVVPGVAVGFPLYLVLRYKQIQPSKEAS